MITEFNQDNLKTLRQDLNKALKAIADAHGVQISIGNMRFNAGEVRCKLTAQTKTRAAAQPKVGQLKPGGDLGYGMLRHNITTSANNAGETLIEYKPSRPKYPFVMQGPRGGKWKLTVQEAQQRFGTK